MPEIDSWIWALILAVKATADFTPKQLAPIRALLKPPDKKQEKKIQEKIATGRLEKYYKEVCLVEQVFVKDPDLTIDKLTDKVSKEVGSQLAIAGFMRWVLGETSGAQPEESC